jgi:hypothetical protein
MLIVHIMVVGWLVCIIDCLYYVPTDYYALVKCLYISLLIFLSLPLKKTYVASGRWSVIFR